MKTVVKGARHVAQDSLDGLQMLHHGPLHEPAHIPDGEHKVRPGMDQLAQAPDQPPVMGWIDLLRRALSTQLKLLLHRGVGRIIACHATELEDALGIVGLAEGDPGGVLVHFDAEVEAEEAEVTMSNALNTSTFCSSAPVMMRSST